MDLAYFLRYTTSERRVIGAIVGWDPGASKIRIHWTCFTRDFPYFNYARAATTTMVMGHLLATLAEGVQPDMRGDLKVFCIGHSLGSHVCGYAGKGYR